MGTAEEIRAEIARRIKLSDALDGDCRKAGAPSPQRLQGVDGSGCNWTISVLPATVPGCNEVVLAIVAAVQSEYNLPSK